MDFYKILLSLTGIKILFKFLSNMILFPHEIMFYVKITILIYLYKAFEKKVKTARKTKTQNVKH